MDIPKRNCCLLILIFHLSAGCFAQMPVEHVEETVKALGLSSQKEKGITIYFTPADSLRSMEFASLSAGMSAFFKKEINIGFDFKVAALQPGNWFSEFPGIPYAIPWPYFPDRIIMMPASLDEGIMVTKERTRQQNKWFVDFVMVHEYCHFLEKDFFRPGDTKSYISLKWFGEFMANYLAYAYIYTADKDWAGAVKKLWKENLKAYTPTNFSLNWSFMNELPPQELGPTYGWYQVMLNLKAAELYEKYGLDLLHTLKKDLVWHDSKNWTTASILPQLENKFPGFIKWSENIEGYAKELTSQPPVQ
jgi:hypothetical protein